MGAGSGVYECRVWVSFLYSAGMRPLDPGKNRGVVGGCRLIFMMGPGTSRRAERTILGGIGRMITAGKRMIGISM